MMKGSRFTTTAFPFLTSFLALAGWVYDRTDPDVSKTGTREPVVRTISDLQVCQGVTLPPAEAGFIGLGGGARCAAACTCFHVTRYFWPLAQERALAIANPTISMKAQPLTVSWWLYLLYGSENSSILTPISPM